MRKIIFISIIFMRIMCVLGVNKSNAQVDDMASKFLVEMGLKYYQTENIERAISSFKKALLVNPKN